MSRVVRILRAGRMSYAKSLRLQRLVAASHVGTLILTEHPPVYTIGIRTNAYPEYEERRLKALGADYHRTNRGGLVTFHGPGQLIAYPIIDLKNFVPSVRWYVQSLEEVVIKMCLIYGVKAERCKDTGVWCGNDKICAIGVHASRYKTSHGLALNCDSDLNWFSHIVPCGLPGKGVTSLTRQLDHPITVDEVTPTFLKCFAQVFVCELKEMDPEEVHSLLRASDEDVLSNEKIRNVEP
ncbi:putative lipoyltransferase 2, mitochondrial [Ctenocephalides felis]|uniref:putative lipoyltransferase 2, mitochondrial n=1 Tax=Ctenocephalides felis TaxID=7515 RepID=UPI000E6E51E5|nr:putative lipoyltransferase 2, mitochondrial [Ctenocephalides felis]XP_026467012.1 putative lipoyltransferase 2, mitochondrial [Ctenocephalides felis]